MSPTKKLLRKKQSNTIAKINQGDCVQIINSKNLFQVIGIDKKHQKCWVRQWPLMSKGSPVFEIPIKEIDTSSKNK